MLYALMRTQRRVWIGGTKDLGTWRWCTTTRFDYANWAPNEPNGGKKSNLKIAINGDWPFNESLRGRWSDLALDDAEVTGYLCEWDY